MAPMKRMLLVSLAAALFASGCTTPAKSPSATQPPARPAPTTISSTAMEGTWAGREITAGREGTATLKISGQTLEFHGEAADDWIKGTFTVQEDANPRQCVGIATDCAAPEYIGKKF